MRRLALAAPALGVPLLLAPFAGAEDRTVQATAQNTFTPGTVTIDPGDTVTWTSAGGVNHTVTSSSSNWSKDSQLPAPTTTTAYTFESPGTYTYYCKTHGTPSSGMRGAVVVRSPATSSPRPTPTRTTSSPRPTPSPTPAPTTSSPSPSEDPDPGPRPTTTPPATTPSTPPVTASPTGSRSPVPVPPTGGEAAPPTPGPVYVGDLGLPYPSTRKRGLAIALALVAIGGVVSAQVRTLLAEPVRKG